MGKGALYRAKLLKEKIKKHNINPLNEFSVIYIEHIRGKWSKLDPKCKTIFDIARFYRPYHDTFLAACKEKFGNQYRWLFNTDANDIVLTNGTTFEDVVNFISRYYPQMVIRDLNGNEIFKEVECVDKMSVEPLFTAFADVNVSITGRDIKQYIENLFQQSSTDICVFSNQHDTQAKFIKIDTTFVGKTGYQLVLLRVRLKSKTMPFYCVFPTMEEYTQIANNINKNKMYIQDVHASIHLKEWRETLRFNGKIFI